MADVTNLDVRCPSCNSIITPNKPSNVHTYKIIGALALAFIGLRLGDMILMASQEVGFQFTASIPLAALGLYFGYLTGSYTAHLLDGITCPECNSEIDSPRRDRQY